MTLPTLQNSGAGLGIWYESLDLGSLNCKDVAKHLIFGLKQHLASLLPQNKEARKKCYPKWEKTFSSQIAPTNGSFR